MRKVFILGVLGSSLGTLSACATSGGWTDRDTAAFVSAFSGAVSNGNSRPRYVRPRPQPVYRPPAYRPPVYQPVNNYPSGGNGWDCDADGPGTCAVK